MAARRPDPDGGLISQLRKIAFIIERRDYPLLSLYLFVVLASTVLEAGGIGLVFVVLQIMAKADLNEANRLVQYLHNILGGEDRFDFLARTCIATFAVFLARTGGLYCSAWVAQESRARIHVALATHLLRNYLFAPYAWLLTQSSARLFTNVTNNVAEVSRNCVVGLLDILAAIILLAVFSIGAVLARPLEMSAIVGILAIALLGYFAFLRQTFAQWGKASVEANATSARAIAEPLEGLKSIKVMELESYFVDKYSLLVSTHMRLLVRHTVAQNTPRYVLEVLLVGVLLTIAVVTSTSDPAIFALFLVLGAAAYRMLPSATRIIQGLQLLRYSQVALDLIVEGLCLKAAEANKDANSKPIMRRISNGNGVEVNRIGFRSVTLRNVSFRFPQGPTPAIENVTIEIACGELVGLVGRSGSGKSTLADIVLGLLVPAKGSITFECRAPRVAYVPQESFLVEDTVLRNVALGVPDADIDYDLVRSAIRDSALDQFVANLPNGLDTLLGGQGVRLSGGERQRLGIARALYRRAELMVLDEPTSALDAMTEAAIADTLERLRGRCTIVVIAHRVNMIRNFDKIVLLDRGRVLATGRFSELYDREVEFKRMVDFLSSRLEQRVGHRSEAATASEALE
jgi:ABC-type multidrug transport system fused ATPase/permease subunit